jgi:predicted SnoaL-like aldol condensation-catalyzing enzyme
MKKIVLTIAAFTLLIGNSCQDKNAIAELEKFRAQAQIEEQNKVLAHRFHYDLAIDRNWDLAEEILASDVVIHNPVGEDIKGIEGVKQFDEMYKNMPNMKINHYETIAEGDYVFVRWDIAFDHTKDLMGIPATGNHISDVYGMDLFLIKDGKIKEFWQNYDELRFLKLMGAIPAP